MYTREIILIKWKIRKQSLYSFSCLKRKAIYSISAEVCFWGFILWAVCRRKICYEIFSAYCMSQLGSANNTFTIKARPTHAAPHHHECNYRGGRRASLGQFKHTCSLQLRPTFSCDTSPVLMFPSSRPSRDSISWFIRAGERSEGRRSHKTC